MKKNTYKAIAKRIDNGLTRFKVGDYIYNVDFDFGKIECWLAGTDLAFYNLIFKNEILDFLKNEEKKEIIKNWRF